MKFCKACLEYIPVQAKICPACDFSFVQKIDPVKNLTTAPDQSARLFKSEAPKIQKAECGAVTLVDFTSRDGNKCLRVDYKSPGIVPINIISEYFRWDFSRMKCSRRLAELGCEQIDQLEQQAKVTPKKIPKFVFYENDGKFNKITRLEF